jgi:hypothetical protein
MHGIPMAKGGTTMATDPQTRSAEEKLRELATSSERSKTSQIRELMPLIEELKAKGRTNEQIRCALKSSGLEMSLKTFESVLHRIRKARSVGPQSPEVTRSTAVSPRGGPPTIPSQGSKPTTPADLCRLRERSNKTAEDAL